MIDLGLAVSLVAMLAVPALLAHRSQLHTIPTGRLVDVALPALALGLVVGRLAFMATAGSGSLRIGDVVVVRAGVEFWPAVGSGVLVLALMARRRRVSPLRHLAELAPFALLASATYEALCLVRDGCFGPASPIGLVPSGMATRQFPVGLLVAAVLTSLALLLRQAWTLGPGPLLITAFAGVSLVRVVSGWWLPHLGDGMSRQQAQSAGVLVLMGLVGAGLVLRQRLHHRRNATPSGPIAYRKGP